MFWCRALLVVSLIATLVTWAAGAPLIDFSDVASRPLATSFFTNTESIRQDHAYFEIPCHDDHEGLPLSFGVRKPFRNVACGYSDLIVHGQPLIQDWSNLDSGFAIGTQLITVPGLVDHPSRVLEITTKSICLDIDDPFKDAIVDPSVSEATEITSVAITAIDGKIVNDIVGFTVSFDQSKRLIHTILPLPEHPSIWPRPSSPVLSSNPIASDPMPSGLIKQDGQPQKTVEKEIRRLRDLEADLSELTHAVDGQRQLVNDLTSSHIEEAKSEFNKCEDVACFLNTLVQKAKGCIHIIILRYGPHGPDVHHEDGSHECVWPETREERMQALLNGRQLCLGSADADAGRQLNTSVRLPGRLSGSSSSSVSSYRPSSYFGLPSSLDTTHTIHTALGVATSLFCLTCFAKYLHRRCCNPRVQAERAARKEERRTRRQYRRLARRKAWKDWWNVRILRNDMGSSTDYEEKRSLILSQEAVLENAMQEEMRLWRDAHGVIGDLASAAEQGRAYPGSRFPSNQSDSLPTYRSRASSGRPPSYNEVDAYAGHNHVFISSATDETPHASTSPATDATPDSSVAALSPRHSSETLRTERSGF